MKKTTEKKEGLGMRMLIFLAIFCTIIIIFLGLGWHEEDRELFFVCCGLAFAASIIIENILHMSDEIDELLDGG